MRLRHAFLALFLAAAAAAAPPGGRRELAAAHPGAAIVGGVNVPERQRGRYQWMVSLRSSISQFHFCGATLIGQRILLTAAQ